MDNPKSLVSNLRSNCLSFPEVLAQAFAVIAPTASPTVNIPLAFASAGSGTWFTYVVATVGLVLVSFNINQFARNSASPGSLYSYIKKGLGSTVGVMTGWALILACLGTGMAVLCGFSNYANVLLTLVGLKVSSILLFAICAAIVWYFAYRDIKLSAITMLIFELASVALILLLALIVLSHHGFAVDTSQLGTKHVVISALAVLFMLVPVYGSLYPVPPIPYSVFPYLFLMFVVTGGVWFYMPRVHSPHVLTEVQTDLEEAVPIKVTSLLE